MRFQKTLIPIIIFTVCCFFQNLRGQDWPKEIVKNGGTITIYQPQVESFNDIKLEARAAISVQLNKNDEMIFGAMWFSCLVSTDRDSREVILRDVEITNSRFPDRSSEEIDKLSRIILEEIPKWDLVLSLDNLLSQLEVEKKEKSNEYKFDPPEIIFVEKPAVLITIDGDPILKEVEDSKLKYVVNTPIFLVLKEENEIYYLKGGRSWYSSKDIMKDWKETKNIPKDVKDLGDKIVPPDKESHDESGDYTVPDIIVRTAAAELIETFGKPEYSSIDGTNLLYVKNSESEILMDINSQNHFILISGRWYQSKSLSGSWEYLAAEDLPEDFSKIPPESTMSGVLVSVPGTEQAKEAVLDTHIPQTAEVNRKEATLEVKYDGDPKFEQVEDQEVYYAVNTDKSVVLFEDVYYACENAVWFESDAPTGPWIVAVKIPDEIYDIPPSNPVYNITYVKVYKSTPDIVYVGYYPGYVGCYVYGPTVIYGTGYYYRPWYGAYYYPRPVTYGFGVHYNPYAGWSLSFGMTFGGPHAWFHVGWGGYPAHRGWWGPVGYHSGYRHGYYHGRAAGYASGYRRGYYDARRDNLKRRYNRNAYKNQRSGIRQPSLNRNVQTRRASNKLNNVYTDRNGGVYKKTKSGWQKRDKNQWSSTRSNDSRSFKKKESNLNKSRVNRYKGANRTNKFKSSNKFKGSSKRSKRP